MSLQTMQTALARAVTRLDSQACGAELSADEQRRLAQATQDPGIEVVRTLYRGWRLAKIVSLLPLTVAATPTDEIDDILNEFWEHRDAISPYFVEECLAFLDFLADRHVEQSERMVDITNFERARLELHDEVAGGATAAHRVVVLRNRPGYIFSTASSSDEADSDHRPNRSVIRGDLDESGHERWRVIQGPDAGKELPVGAAAH